MSGLEKMLPSADLLTYLANLALAASLTCGIGLLTARTLRYRSAPLRHAVLAWTLALTLLSPGAVWLAQRHGLALVRIDVTEPADARGEADTRANMPTATVGAEREETIVENVPMSAVGMAPHVASEPMRMAGGTPTAAVGTETEERTEENAAVPAVGMASKMASKPSGWRVAAAAAAMVWTIGVLAGLVRLAWGCVGLIRFCRRLEPLVEPRKRLLVHRAADALGLRRLPRVYLSPMVNVPVSIGLARPAIVLPEAMLDEAAEDELMAVLLHETAHIARRDHPLGVAQRLAAALYWWNPLVHRTCGAMSELREEICDNHVVLIQGEGQRLARLLVDLAARVTASPLLPSTVGVLEPELAGLTGRVRRLLNEERTMETRMTWKSRVFVLTCAMAVLIAMATVGGLRLAQAESEGNMPTTAVGMTSEKKETNAPTAAVGMAPSTEASPQGQFDFRGQVLDPEGKPLAGASIYFVSYTNYTHDKLPPPEVRATSGPDGRFHFVVDASEFDARRSKHPWGLMDDANFRNDCRLIAVAEGYGPVWQPAFVFDKCGGLRERILKAHPKDAEAIGKESQPVLRMVKDDVPLVGRVVDPQGQPIAGVKVAIRLIEPVLGEDLTNWLAEAQKENADFVKTMKCFSLALVSHGSFTDGFLSADELPRIASTATSDADGRFRLTGIGRERIAVLSIEGPGIESALMFHGRTRPGPTLVIPHQLPYFQEKMTFYGATFEHVAKPSVPIVGTIRDKDTGKPLPGVTVQAHKLANNSAPDFMVGHHIQTTTDAEGRYRLTGMPLGKDNALLAVPPKDQPYLLSKKTADTEAARGKDSLTLDFELKRGVWIRGRVSDAKTGEPVSRCIVEYVVFLGNPHCKSAPGFEGAHQFAQYMTDKDGRYVVRALPGRGIVAVQAWGKGETIYPLGAGAEKIPELRGGSGKLKAVLPKELYTQNQHAFAEVNPAEGAESVELDFALKPGEVLTGTVSGPDGKPLAGAHCHGLTEQGGWTQLDSEFAVNCYQPKQPRNLLFIHLERKLAGSRKLTGDQTAPLRVALLPWGTITGRVVDADGKPLAGIEIQDQDLPRYLSVKEPDGTTHRVNESFTTDKEGRFRIEGLAPWWKYNLSGWDKPGKRIEKLASDVAVEPGQTKDLGDLKLKPPHKQDSSTWGLNMHLEAPSLTPPVVQYAVFDKDPIPGLKTRIKQVRPYYREHLEKAEDDAAKALTRSSQMTVSWDLGFQDITADKLYLLPSASHGTHGISSNGPDGPKWLVSKVVQINGKPTCWCVPVEVKKGKQIDVTFTEANVFNLEATYDEAMREPEQAK